MRLSAVGGFLRAWSLSRSSGILAFKQHYEQKPGRNGSRWTQWGHDGHDDAQTIDQFSYFGGKEILNMKDLEAITAQIIKFRDERDWEQFHNSKDLALAISIEAAELNELFLWKQPDAVNVEKLKDELADTLIYSFLLAHKHNLDIGEIIQNKLTANAIKYPVEKAKGTAKKYNDL